MHPTFKRLILLSIGLYCISGSVSGQDIQPFGYYLDALRFSQTSHGGTTRIQSMGGIQIALGGDLSSALSNPAGLGLYTRSDASITPVLALNNNSSNYLDNNSNTSLTRFSINQAGVALQADSENNGSFLGGTFAITLTRINDFNNVYSLSGVNQNTSMIDAFLAQANGATTEQFSGNDVISLSYFNYLIGPESVLIPPGPDEVYFTDVTGIPNQEEHVNTSGRQNQWSISYGGNVSDKFYFGLGLGIVSLDYKSQRIYQESFDVDPLNEFVLTENLAINGTGVNATFGIIYRPVPSFKIGVSLITPTIYSLEDTYDATMEANWNNFLYEDAIDGDVLLNNEYAETDILVSNYNLTTPMKLNGGIAYFFGKHGFIGADIEYVDHKKTKLSTDEFSMDDDNVAIQNLANSSLNFKLGGEYRINSIYLRGGFANKQKAIESQEAFYNGGRSYSGGAGWRSQSFYIDLGIIYNTFDQQYAPYFLDDDTPIADINNSKTTIMLTFGANF